MRSCHSAWAARVKAVWYAIQRMQSSERFCAGFALAATIAGDRDAQLASPGLCADIAPPLLTTVRALSALSKKERRDRVRALLQPRRVVWPSEAPAPAMLRAYALLGRGEAQTAPAWVREAPLPRPGFQPTPELLAALRNSASALR